MFPKGEMMAQTINVQVMVTLTALVHPETESGGYSAEVPALPGCFTQGDTLDEVRERLKEAAEGWLAAAHDASVADHSQQGAA
jgi:predicted RNase H-like HicB family nuclease